MRPTIVALVFIITLCISTMFFNYIFEHEAKRQNWLEVPENLPVVGHQAEIYPVVNIILDTDARLFSSIVFAVALALLIAGLVAKANLPRIRTLEDEIISELGSVISKFAGDLELEDVILSEIETP